MGWSWGTSIAGAYTGNHNDKINRLVLYAPLWTFQPSVAPPTSPIPAYRVVAKDDAKARWLKGVPEDKQATLIPPGRMRAVGFSSGVREAARPWCRKSARRR